MYQNSIGKQGETAPPDSRKATFAAFSASPSKPLLLLFTDVT
jgi:hypothetical protein